jgi:hypothetical protein
MSLTKVSYSMIGEAPINVQDFGAVGDGSTITTTALQNAFNAGAGKRIFIPKSAGNYLIDATLNLAENTTLEFENGAALQPSASFTAGTYCLNVGKNCTIENAYITDIVEGRLTIHGIRAVAGTPVAQSLTLRRCVFTRLNIAVYLRGHNNKIEDISAFVNQIAIYIGSSPSETEPGGTSGSAAISGGRINDNYYGVYQSVQGIDSYLFGVIFEYNRRHVFTLGNTYMTSCYMKDAASIGFDGNGKISVQGTDVTSLGIGTPRLDNLGDGWDSTYTGTDFSYGVGVEKAYLSNMVFFNAQRNITPRDRTAWIGSGSYTLSNCHIQMENEYSGVGQFAIADSPFAIKGSVITPESTRKYNYISNGLFTNTAALTSTYINGTFTVDTSRKNPWGGFCLDIYRVGIKLRFKVPNWESNKKYLLIVLKGAVVSGTGQASGVYWVDTDMANYTPPEITTNKESVGNAVCVNGVKHTDRETIGISSFVVTLDASEGEISIFNTLTATTGNEELYGVILTDLDDVNIDALQHIPIGWYENYNLIPYTQKQFTLTNVTDDVSYDANATTVDELADVLGTLIQNLQNKGIVD